VAPVFVDSGPTAGCTETHSTAPAIGALFAAVGDLLDGRPDIKVLQPVGCGRPAKGQLRPDERRARSETQMARQKSLITALPRSGPRRGGRLASDGANIIAVGHLRQIASVPYPMATADESQVRSSSSRHRRANRTRTRPMFAIGIVGHCVQRIDELGKALHRRRNAGIAPMASGADGWRMSRRQPHWRCTTRSRWSRR